MPGKLPDIFLRTVAALLMMAHGFARITYGIVDDFAVFLNTKGFVAGIFLAWGITLFEIIGGMLLISGYYIRYVAAAFALQLLAGIILVHWPEGWFVVGVGRNGMEYSVLLIAVFCALAWKDLKETKL